MKTLKFIIFAVLMLGMVISCSKEDTPEQETIETVNTDETPRQGTEETLFACTTRTDDELSYYLTDHVATVLKEYSEKQVSSSYIVIAKRFDDTEPTAYLTAGLSTYRICNYPQYAKEWDIPEGGLSVLLSGKVYPPSFDPGFQSAILAFFDLELTTLNANSKEVSFAAYSLTSACKWIKSNTNYEVIIINSNKELNPYITCTDGDYPAIDFSKYTLILAQGLGGSRIVSVSCNRLQQFAEHHYKMDVDLSLGISTVESPWQIPIIVDKLSDESTVGLVVTLK
jgi:hypothetical protein